MSSAITKPYSFNPHRHVKIWLSKKPDTFLPVENQHRLMKLRAYNPNDEISLVYDPRLLDSEAKNELIAFCTRYAITPVNVEEDVIGDSVDLSPLERQMVAAYNEELEAIQTGSDVGNPAAASDILRWMGPVTRRGIYSDCDLVFCTQGLEEKVGSDSPILLNLGSVNALSMVEVFVFANDFIVIADHDAAKDQIEKVQRMILNAYGLKNAENDAAIAFSYAAYVDVCIEQLRHSRFFPRFLLNFIIRVLDVFCSVSTELNKLRIDNENNYQSATKVRRLLAEEKGDHFAFTKRALKALGITDEGITSENYIKESAARYRTYLSNKVGFIGWVVLSSSHYHSIKKLIAMPDEKLNEHMRDDVYGSLYRLTVLASTGPNAVAAAMMSGTSSNADEAKKCRQSAIQDNNPQGVFHLETGLPMRIGAFEAMRRMHDSEKPEEVNDCSWTTLGAQMQQLRGERAMAMLQDEQTNLAANLTTLTEDIQQHIDKIDGQLKGTFGFYRNRARQAKIKALKDVQGCLDDDTSTFDAKTFLASIKQYRSVDIEAGLGQSSTKALIDKAERLGNIILLNGELSFEQASGSSGTLAASPCV